MTFTVFFRLRILLISVQCYPGCQNNGVCVYPGYCLCKSGAYGAYCQKGRTVTLLQVWFFPLPELHLFDSSCDISIFVISIWVWCIASTLLVLYPCLCCSIQYEMPIQTESEHISILNSVAYQLVCQRVLTEVFRKTLR